MTDYKFHHNGIAHEIESSSDLLALKTAIYITGDETIKIFRRNDKVWSPLSLGQMLYGRNAAENLMNAFGSKSARTIKKAEKIFAAAA